MDRQNFKNGNHRFPVSTEALEFIQNQIMFVAKLTSIVGTNVIITPATTTTDGLVIIAGELLPLLKGNPKPYISITEIPESITAGAINFEGIRIKRVAQYAYSGYDIGQFTTLNNIVTLMSRVAAIEGSYLSSTDINALVQAVQNNVDTTDTNLAALVSRVAAIEGSYMSSTAINALVQAVQNNVDTTDTNLAALVSRVETIEGSYKTESEIQDLLNDNAKHHVPKGTVIDWYGTCRAAYVPYGFVPCGMFGRDLSNDTARNEELQAWQSKYSGGITIQRTGTNGAYLKITYCCGQQVPDLTDCFIVQADHNHSAKTTSGYVQVTTSTDTGHLVYGLYKLIKVI